MARGLLGYPNPQSKLLLPGYTNIYDILQENLHWNKNSWQIVLWTLNLNEGKLGGGIPSTVLQPRGLTIITNDRHTKDCFKHLWNPCQFCPKIGCLQPKIVETHNIHPGKLTWQWQTNHLKMYLLFKKVIFHCHVSFFLLGVTFKKIQDIHVGERNHFCKLERVSLTHTWLTLLLWCYCYP